MNNISSKQQDPVNAASHNSELAEDTYSSVNANQDKKLLSQEAKEIMSYSPARLFRISIVIGTFVMLSLLSISLFIKYPDTVEGPIIITTDPPLQPLFAKESSIVSSLWVKNDDTVQTGDLVLMFKNDIDYEQIEYLTKIAKSILKVVVEHDTLDVPTLAPALPLNNDYLSAYYGLMEKWHRYQQLESKQTSGNSIDAKKELLGAIINAEKYIERWTKKYIVRSEVTGKSLLFFDKEIFKEVRVQRNEYLGYLINCEYNLIGKINIPTKGLAKIKEGQRVLISLDYYPEELYGNIEGIVEGIHMEQERGMPNLRGNIAAPKNIRTVYVTLKSLKTTRDIEVELSPDLSGSAKIITSDRSIFSRLFSKIIK